MALSNWDTLAVNEKGAESNGVFVSPYGVSIEIYKNWIYVGDGKAWHEGERYSRPIVMEIQQGDLTYKDVQVFARRGPQNGVYVVVQSAVYSPALEKDCLSCKVKAGGRWHEYQCPAFVDTKYLAMIGCGVYGYRGSEWVGVEEESKQFLAHWLKESDIEEIEIPRGQFEHFTDEQIREHYQAIGERVSRITDEYVFIEYENYQFDNSMRNIDLSKALRFNQGDLYLSDQMRIEASSTPTGSAEEPLFMKLVKSIT